MMVLAVVLVLAIDCGQCHPKQADSHSKTLMAQTLERGNEAKILKAYPRLEYSAGSYNYAIENHRYRVTNGTRAIEAPILWAMGQGEAGQTYILDVAGKLYESRVSFYDAIGGLAPTIGAPAGNPKTLDEAVGRELTTRAAAECFGCHSAINDPVAKTFTPGVQCISCHTTAEKHAAQSTVKPVSLSKASAEDLSEVCGKCHRTWADIAANGPRGVANVRFQPYRITRSKCYDAADRRIGCTSCHNPHDRPNRAVAVAATDRACAACHAKLCPTGAKSECSSCHMPKFELPGSHFKFTDHWIRIAKNGTYPD